MATKSRSMTVCFFAIWFAALGAEQGKHGKVEIIQEKGKLHIQIGGEPFADYVYEGYAKPFLFPLLGPGGVQMTRNWPIKQGVPDEDKDHPHHKSWWWAHGNMNGIDFWSEGKDAGKTIHEAFTEVSSGEMGIIRSKDKYVSVDGKVICTDDRTWRILGGSDPRIFDFEITLHASNGDLRFGDTKEGTMAMRLNETMRFKGKVGKGHIINSEGVRDDDTWGKRANWVDYYGPADGKLVGVAIFDHPKNPRHPTWWHVRDYGLFAANPFGLHDFEKKPADAGNLTVPSGQSITFRYRFYIHSGDEKEGKVAQAYEQYAKSAALQK
jgi:hypothetical protein